MQFRFFLVLTLYHAWLRAYTATIRGKSVEFPPPKKKGHFPQKKYGLFNWQWNQRGPVLGKMAYFQNSSQK